MMYNLTRRQKMPMVSVTTQQHNKAGVGVSVRACTICGEEEVGWCVLFLSCRGSCTVSGLADSVDGERIRWSHKSSN